MVSSDGNRVLTMLHTHVYDSSKRVWKEHVILGGKFYAQAATKFFANFAHHNGISSPPPHAPCTHLLSGASLSCPCLVPPCHGLAV